MSNCACVCVCVSVMVSKCVRVMSFFVCVSKTNEQIHKVSQPVTWLKTEV